VPSKVIRTEKGWRVVKIVDLPAEVEHVSPKHHILHSLEGNEALIVPIEMKKVVHRGITYVMPEEARKGK